MRALLVCIFLVLNASPATARDAVGLAAPEKVRDSGLLDHILPRFSLKTAIRVVSDPDGPMRLGADGDGIPVFRRDGVTYRLIVLKNSLIFGVLSGGIDQVLWFSLWPCRPSIRRLAPTA